MKDNIGALFFGSGVMLAFLWMGWMPMPVEMTTHIDLYPYVAFVLVALGVFLLSR